MSSKTDSLTELKSVSTTIWQAFEKNKIHSLQAKDFRVIINCYKKLQPVLKVHSEILTQLSDQLLQILIVGELSVDSQMVASTAYCLTITHLYNSETIFQTFLKILSRFNEVHKVESLSSSVNIKKYDLFKICLCHGVLQCGNEIWSNSSDSESINNILNGEILPIVCKLCFQYNNLCLISFKVLVNLIKKISSINKDSIKLMYSNVNKIMKIIMSNWENPLSGVREQNILVLEQLLITNKDCRFLSCHSTMIEENTDSPLLYLILTEQSWMMKCKYFLVSAVLRTYGVNKVMSIYSENIVTGLLLSTQFTQLVSAGSDLYEAIISAFTLDQWQNTFLIPIYQALSEASNKLQVEYIINYWIPNTVKKYPLSLISLIEKLSSEQNVNLYSYVSLMKLARKEGCRIADWDEINYSLLISGLLSDCDKIRSQTFYLICVSSKSSALPSDEEVKLVKLFLHQNVNIDNAMMRQNLLNAFTIFIFRMKDSSLKEIGKQKKISDIEILPAVDKCLDFLEWLYTFFINNFLFDCNYQRKCTSLHMYSILLNAFCNQMNNKENYHGDLEILLNIGKTNGKWKLISKESQHVLLNNIYNPADDIRTKSAEILTSYFNIEESESVYYKDLLQNALQLCKNPVFYEAESGSLLLQTIVILISNSEDCVKQNILSVFGKCGKVLDYLIDTIEEQIEEFSKDMLYAVVNGCSLYGELNALEKIFSYPASPEYRKLSNDQIVRIIVLTENIVSLLLNVLSVKSDTNSDFAPSFGEMGMAVASLVQQSLVTDKEDLQKYQHTDGNVIENGLDLQLTPAQQLLLNCIWHNMKICSSISNKLISTSYLNVEDAKRCMHLLCRILCKCRHKGVIESAGLAIYQATKFLTANQRSEFCDIPKELLHQFLSSLVSANSTTISRRSAGLAILVHRIAAGDVEQGKPLLHICVSKLLLVFEDFKEPTELHLADLPQSRALHFLQTLVQDSSLRQEMTKYIVQISLLCFGYLGSSVWTLRNAALQLFGALLPKLTGQNKIQETETHSTCYHLAIEELYFHIKPLFKMMIDKLSLANTTSSLQVHSSIMPLLTLFSNLTVSFQSLLDIELYETNKLLTVLFQNLLKSRIYKVRELCAKISAWFCLPSEILDRVQNRVKHIINYVANKQSVILNNNELHGYLLNIKYLVRRYFEEKTGNRLLQNKEEIFKDSFKEFNIISKFKNQHSLICNVVLEIIEDTGLYNEYSLDINKETQTLMNFSDISGSYKVAYFNLQYIINNYDSKNNINILRNFMFNTNFDICMIYLETLKSRIKKKRCNDEKDMLCVFDEALCSLNYKSQIVELILEIILELLSHDDFTLSHLDVINRPIYFDILYNFKFGSKCSVIALPIICGIISKQSRHFSFTDKLGLKILERSSPVCSEEMRMSAAKSLFFIFPYLKKLSNEGNLVGNYIWKSTLNLIRDENKDIRLETSKFVFKYFPNEFGKWFTCEYKPASFNLLYIKSINAFVALEFLFQTLCLNQFMSEKQAVLTMWEMLATDEISFMDKSKTDILNPFSNDKNNIYEEQVILINMIENSICSLLPLLKEEDFLKVKNIILDQINLKTFDKMANKNFDLKCKKLQSQSKIVNVLKKLTT